MPIMFEGKYKRARKLQKERMGDPGGQVEVPLGDRLEKGDIPAMIIAGLITILPVALLALVVISAVGFFFVVR